MARIVLNWILKFWCLQQFKHYFYVNWYIFILLSMYHTKFYCHTVSKSCFYSTSSSHFPPFSWFTPLYTPILSSFMSPYLPQYLFFSSYGPLSNFIAYTHSPSHFCVYTQRWKRFEDEKEHMIFAFLSYFAIQGLSSFIHLPKIFMISLSFANEENPWQFYLPHCQYIFIWWWTPRWFLFPCYYEQCSDKHRLNIRIYRGLFV